MQKFILIYGLLLSANLGFATNWTQCIDKDFRNRMGPPRSQQTENTCWAFTATKIFEEEICRQTGACGLELSVADIMRCKFTLGAAPPERAIHCALTNGLCSESSAPYPFHSNSITPFSALWNNPNCANHRYQMPQQNSSLVVRGKPITIDPDGIGLEPGDDFIENANLLEEILKSFADDHSVLAAIYTITGSRHGIILNGMRWNTALNRCEVYVYDTTTLVGNGWRDLENIARNTYRVAWIQSGP